MAVIECPFCGEVVEVKPPDQLHNAFSLVQPVARSYHGDIMKEQAKCENPECKKSITVFWYAPLVYFDRI